MKARRAALGPAGRGFTLPEVLATLVLVGVVLPVAMRGVTTAVQATATAKHKTEAGQLAETKLNELLILRDSSQFESSGDFGEAWPGYRWVTHGLPGDGSLYDVNCTVYWSERGQDRSIVLSTMILPTDAVSTATAVTSGGTP